VEDEADHEALLAHLAQTRRDDTVGSGIAKLIFDNLTGQAAAKAREAPLLCLQVAQLRRRLPRSVCLLFTLPAGARRRGEDGLAHPDLCDPLRISCNLSTVESTLVAFPVGAKAWEKQERLASLGAHLQVEVLEARCASS
jgi:hypothetical protein